MTNAVRSVGRSVRFEPTANGWRSAARELLQERVAPDVVSWEPLDDAQETFGTLGAPVVRGDVLPNRDAANQLHVPRAFLRLVATVACHRSPSRWATLYRILWRFAHGEPHVLDIVTDPDVHALGSMERAVRRAAHKMKAFVRFRCTLDSGSQDPVYVAWFEPVHRVVERVAPFFAERFAAMRWSILTPDRCAHWDGKAVRFTPGMIRSAAPSTDELEGLWRTYYAHIFNPARLNLDAMRGHMPQHYWTLLPEARLIGDLARDAPHRVARMLAETQQPPEPVPNQLEATGQASNPAAFARALHGGARLTRHEAEIRALAIRDSIVTTDDPLHDPGAVVARDRASRMSERAPRELLRETGGVVRFGVAGWTDPSLLEPGVFYPDDATTPEARLRYYASLYPLVEVDATYYALPTRAIADRWVARTPANFMFDIKAHALMTGHGADPTRLPPWVASALPKRMQRASRVFPGMLPVETVDELWRAFLDALEPLRTAGKLGAVLLQFPPWFKATAANADTLRRARERLGSTLGAVEFRHRGWLAGRVADRTLELLTELGLAYVIVDGPQGMESSIPPTIGETIPQLAVVRLHGRRAETWERRHTVVSERYRYLYDELQLRTWTLPIVDIAKRHQGVHVLFNNNHANYATTNALEMSAMLSASCFADERSTQSDRSATSGSAVDARRAGRNAAAIATATRTTVDAARGTAANGDVR